MSNLSELLPTGGGQNAVEFTAAENISAGQAVALRTDGQIEAADSANQENIIGLAAEAITSGSTGNVNVFGGINEAQSSLTIGSDYYINSSGSLTTSNTKPYVAIGQAISATTLNLRDESDNYVVPISGQASYTTPGTYSWVAPTGITSVSVVVVGAGGQGGSSRGGGGGGLAYKNNMSVTAGSSYTVVVGTSTYTTVVPGEGTSSFTAGITVSATAGSSGTLSPATGGTGSNGDANYTGGTGGSATGGGGGGGAAGYSGNGGSGGAPSGAGSGGSASGGVNGVYYDSFTRLSGGGGGGGVGLLGEGASGASQSQINTGTFADANQPGGEGGSSGADGQVSQGNGGGGVGGLPGGGGGGGGSTISSRGAYGGVRIIWSDTITRTFPSTNTGDL